MKQKTKEIKSVLLRFILIVVFVVGCVVVLILRQMGRDFNLVPFALTESRMYYFANSFL